MSRELARGECSACSRLDRGTGTNHYYQAGHHGFGWDFDRRDKIRGGMAQTLLHFWDTLQLKRAVLVGKIELLPRPETDGR